MGPCGPQGGLCLYLSEMEPLEGSEHVFSPDLAACGEPAIEERSRERDGPGEQ